MSPTLFKMIPTCFLSRQAGYLTRMPLPRVILYPVIRWFTNKYGIKNEYEIPEGGFRTFNQFFTRRLRPGVHQIDRAKDAVVSPVDARVDQFGPITGSTIIQAKGLTYTLEELIPSKTAEQFRDGSFMVLYLSPSDYHRIHAPVSGSITGWFHVPGRLFTVQEYFVQQFRGLFAVNERLISYVKSPAGLVAVCKIGAFNVGSMSLSYNGVRTNRFFRRRHEELFHPAHTIAIKAGDELGMFNLGSTIVLVFQKGMVALESFQAGDRVRVGQRIGRLLGSA